MSEYQPVVQALVQHRERDRLMGMIHRPKITEIYYKLDFLVWDTVSSIIVGAVRRRIKNRE